MTIIYSLCMKKYKLGLLTVLVTIILSANVLCQYFVFFSRI